jgi:hypothetical protein
MIPVLRIAPIQPFTPDCARLHVHPHSAEQGDDPEPGEKRTDQGGAELWTGEFGFWKTGAGRQLRPSDPTAQSPQWGLPDRAREVIDHRN